MGMIDHFLQPEVRPFAIAAVMIGIVGTIEALSMLIGAFIACVGSALGGQQRDEYA